MYITDFHGGLLFNGTDSGNHFQLWYVSASGTDVHEITGVAGASSSGLDPRFLFSYEGSVLFRGDSGTPGNSQYNLWITNGTSAGTKLLSGIANAYSGGLLPDDPDFTALNGQVLFEGRDAANNIGLWITNGSSAGTYELAPIAGAMVVGSPGSDVNPQWMAVLGSEALFDGADQQDTPGSLWETNGTAGGTFEIGGQGNAGIVGSPNGDANQLPFGIQPYDLTTYNRLVIFAGYDNTLRPNGFYERTDGLWVSDGTAGGTFEIGGIANAGIANVNSAQNGGIFDVGSVAFPDFTMYNGLIYFVGMNAAGSLGLWVTNGAASGTHQITGFSSVLNFSGSINPDFTVYDNELYFQGLDSSNFQSLWVSNGTGSGTKELTPINNAAGDFVPSDLTASTYHPQADLLGTGTSDVVWYNPSTGDVGYWSFSNNGTTVQWHDFGQGSTTVKPVGVGDLNGDGNADLLWQNPGNNLVGEWNMYNGAPAWSLIDQGSTTMQIAGVGDFYGTGTSDVLWENPTNNLVGMWEMNDNIDTWNLIGQGSTTVKIAGTGDFTGNGISDILWENPSNGIVGMWLMTGPSPQWYQIGQGSTTMNIVGIGDFTGNGADDILWENPSNGIVGMWQVQGASAIWSQIGVATTSYQVAAIGDYAGTGTDDILWRNATTGDVGVWLMNNGTPTWHDLGISSTAFNAIKT
jgi:ELWxxDGT repeat protein